jgi:replication factor C large subunit
MTNHTIPLFEKYRPKKISDVKGQELAADKIKAYMGSFNKSTAKKKAVILYGPAGTGKTTLAHATANDMEFELFELNASDLRNRAKLDEVLGPSTQQKSLFAKGKIILVDEVDGVTATDYGGLAELIVLIERSKFPIIITCNDIWQNKFSLLRNKCEMIPVKELTYELTLNLLKQITLNENKKVNELALKEIAAKSRGDLRAALNDLQSILYMEEFEVLEREFDLREKTQDIFNALKEVFKLRMNKETIKAYDNVDLEMDQITLWLEENIPTEYRGQELAKAFDALSRADIFKGRIHRQQYWHFMTYQNFFLTAGISAAKGSKNLVDRYTKYNPPKRLLKIWMINQKNSKKKSIAGKFAELTHTGKKRAARDFNIISLLINEDIIKELNLEDAEKEYLSEKRAEVLHSLGKLTI